MAKAQDKASADTDDLGRVQSDVVPNYTAPDPSNIENPVALCHLEHEGVEYNFGDPVPAEVVKTWPTAVGEAPLTPKAINAMSPEEMQAALLKLSGNEPS